MIVAIINTGVAYEKPYYVITKNPGVATGTPGVAAESPELLQNPRGRYRNTRVATESPELLLKTPELLQNPRSCYRIPGVATETPELLQKHQSCYRQTFNYSINSVQILQIWYLQLKTRCLDPPTPHTSYQLLKTIKRRTSLKIALNLMLAPLKISWFVAIFRHMIFVEGNSIYRKHMHLLITNRHLRFYFLQF